MTVVPGADPISRPERSAPGSLFFRMGTIFSSKYSMAMEDMSRSSCSTSCALCGARVELTYRKTRYISSITYRKQITTLSLKK